jgi:hypothetical protein
MDHETANFRAGDQTGDDTDSRCLQLFPDLIQAAWGCAWARAALFADDITLDLVQKLTDR